MWRERLKGRRELLVFVALVGLALVPRLYRLASVPPGLNGDEIFNAIDAGRIGPGYWPLFLPGNNGREVFYFYLLAFSQWLFGETLLALRLPSLLLGVGNVWLGYLLGRDLFNRRVGLLAGALLAVSLWPIMHARFAFRAISLTFMTALTLYLFYQGIRQNRRGFLLAGGLALGLTMYTYIPSRVFPAVIVGWLLWIWWWRRRQIRENGRSLLLSLLLAAVVFAPFAVYMVRYPDRVNQRIDSMNNALEQTLAGQPEALVGSVGGVLKMFTIDGDDEWRYHVGTQPVFDPITGLFFYLGVALAVWYSFSRQSDRRRQPEYALLLFWMGAMLAPIAVLDDNPSFLRAAGAMVPIYLLAAIGLDATVRWLAGRWPAVARIAPVFIGAGLLLILARSWHSYFDVWVSYPEVREVYHSDLTAMAHYLEAHPPPEDARVFIASNYVLDYTTPIGFAYYSDREVDWFNRENTFVWPSAETATAWYLIPPENRVPPLALEKLGAAGKVEPVTYEDGTLAFTLYRVVPAALEWAPEQPAERLFEDGIQLLGYDLPVEANRGSLLPLTVHWQIRERVKGLANSLTYLQARLSGAQGAPWAREESLLGYPQAGWQAGDRFVQQMELPLPEGMVPGPATVQVFLRDAEGELYASETEGDDRGQLVVRSQILPDFRPTADMEVFDDTLVLTGANLSTLIAPGLPANIALDWIALESPPVDYRVQLQLALPGQEPFHSQTFTIWPDLYPPTKWQAYEPVTTFHRLQVPRALPDAENAELRVQLLLPLDETPLPLTSGDGVLAELTLEVREHLFEPPPIAMALDAVKVGEDIQLLGYELAEDRVAAGGNLHLTLVWQALQTPPTNYTVFNHLLGPDGSLWGQLDSPPQAEGWLTATWLPGEVVVEERVIPVDPDAPPGRYTLVAGLYTPSDVQRLPVTVGGEVQTADQLILTDVVVE